MQDKGSKTYLFGIVLVAVLGGLLFGYDTAVISGAERGLQAFFMGATDFTYTNFMHGFTASSALIGCVIGSAISGFMAGRFGRKKSLFVAGVCFFLSAAGSYCPEFLFFPKGQPSFQLLIAFNLYRVLGGIGVVGSAGNADTVEAGDVVGAGQIADLGGDDPVAGQIRIVDGSGVRVGDEEAVAAVADLHVLHGEGHDILEALADAAQRTANQDRADFLACIGLHVPNRNGDELIEGAIHAQDVVDVAEGIRIALRDLAVGRKHGIDNRSGDLTDVGDGRQVGIAAAGTPAGDIALDIIQQLVEAVGAGEVDGIAEGGGGVHLVLGDRQLEGDRGVIRQVADAIAGGAAAALGLLEVLAGIDAVHIARRVINVGAPEVALGVAAAVELGGSVGQLGGAHAAEIDADPGSAFLGGDLGVNGGIQGDRGLDGDGDVLGDMLAGLVGIHGGDGDGGKGDTDTTHTTVCLARVTVDAHGSFVALSLKDLSRLGYEVASIEIVNDGKGGERR